MAGLVDQIAQIFSGLQPKKRRRKEALSVKVIEISRQSDVKKLVSFIPSSPAILLSITDYRERNKESLKKAIEFLKQVCAEERANAVMLDPNWVLVYPKRNELVK